MGGSGSLAGLKVVDLSRLLPGPYCSMILADHGAEVIAVEDRRFKEDGLFFNSVNRNKRHISLNLKTDEGKEIFLQLAQQADVVIEGFRPGVVGRLGVDYDTVQKLNPAVIYCSITGYGQDGPLRDRAGHDVNYLSTAGILDLIGPADGPPSIPGVQFADIAGGSMNAVVGILLALQARTTTGRGQYIDISMTDGLLGYLTLPLFFGGSSEKQPQRSDWQLSHRYGCYNTYETADGRYIAIGAVENRFWKRLCELLGVAHYADRQYDDQSREEIVEHLRQIFRQKPAAEWDRLLAGSDVCYSRIQSMDEVLRQPLFIDRQMVLNQKESEAGAGVMLGIPVKLSETPGAIRTGPEAFGASTGKVLLELGYDQEQIDDFSRRGVV